MFWNYFSRIRACPHFLAVAEAFGHQQSPEVEKSCSLWTEVAGTEMHALARGGSKGYWELFSLHHFRRQLLSGIEVPLLLFLSSFRISQSVLICWTLLALLKRVRTQILTCHHVGSESGHFLRSTHMWGSDLLLLPPLLSPHSPQL